MRSGVRSSLLRGRSKRTLGFGWPRTSMGSISLPMSPTDPGVALAAVRHDGLALRFDSRALRGDWGVVLAAVRRTGAALQFATKALQGRL